MPGLQRLTIGDIGCWVIKSRTAPAAIATDWLPGSSRSLSRCLRRSYRVEVMRPGHRCLLWLSGRHAPGVRAIGTLTSEVRLPEAREATLEVEIDVDLFLLTEPVARASLLADFGVAGAEVLRMPAGSNPSYLSPEQLSALYDLLSPDDMTAAGW